jgi:hypothetical protein
LELLTRADDLESLDISGIDARVNLIKQRHASTAG